jgi:hypothetical protein
VGAVGHLQGFFVARDGAVLQLIGGRSALGLFDEMSVDIEELYAGLGERLLDADAFKAGVWLCGSQVGDRIVPEASGPVAALGRPDAARMFTDMTVMSLDCGANLGADALVGAQQR